MFLAGKSLKTLNIFYHFASPELESRLVSSSGENYKLFSFYFRFFAPEREFSNERRRNERQADFIKARDKQQFTDAFGAYLQWICQAGIASQWKSAYPYKSKFLTQRSSRVTHIDCDLWLLCVPARFDAIFIYILLLVKIEICCPRVPPPLLLFHI